MNQQRPLKDEPILSDTEFADAILGAISDGTTTGRARQLGIALLHQALQAVNPLQLAVDDVVLYERTARTDLPLASKTVPVQLDIKQGTTRHNFDDGYFAFTILAGRFNYTPRSNDAYVHGGQRFVSKDRWFATQAGNEAISFRGQFSSRVPTFWKASNTSFFAWTDTGARNEIFKIIGHRLQLNLKTP